MSQVKFVHIRYTNEDGSVSARGGHTIAYREAGDRIEYACAHCSAGDVFNKAYGRAKAQGRLNSDRFRREFENNLDRFRSFIFSEY